MADQSALGSIETAGIRASGVTNFVQDSQEVARNAGSVVAAWLESVAMDPTSIQAWLDRFAQKINDITEHRVNLIDEAGRASGVPLGEFPPSLQIRKKMADRMGSPDGGLAGVLGDIIGPLEDIHEAFRQALAAHLHTDLDSAKEFDGSGPR